MVINHSGVWFYGLAGSGKTFASNVIKGQVDNAFLIDGDEIRRRISFDLGYSLNDRKIQLQRILGIAELTLNNKRYPIVSTVTMNAQILERCNSLDLQVVQISRPHDQLVFAREHLYKDSKNVVGKDIVQERVETKTIENDGTENFEKLVAINVG